MPNNKWKISIAAATALAGMAASAGQPAGAAARASARTSSAAAASTAARVSARSRKISCSTKADSGGGSMYAGPSASRVYDGRFANRAAVPALGTHTPQGLGTWHNWDGKGHDLLLVTAYRSGSNSYVYGIDPVSSRHVGTVQIASTHGGGVTVAGKWIYISGSATSIRKYRTSSMRADLRRAGNPYLKAVGSARDVYGASFLSSYGGYLYAGKFNDSARDAMFRYKIASSGSLGAQSGGWQVPTKAQGVAITGGDFIYSTSYGRHNRGNIYVVRRNKPSLDTAKLYCFRAPSMNEGVTISGGDLFVLFESGSYEYRSSALNPITHLHSARVSSLTSLV